MVPKKEAAGVSVIIYRPLHLTNYDNNTTIACANPVYGPMHCSKMQQTVKDSQLILKFVVLKKDRCPPKADRLSSAKAKHYCSLREKIGQVAERLG